MVPESNLLSLIVDHVISSMVDSYSEQLLNQDVEILSGATVSHSTQVIKQLTGGPYTIDNKGTIEVEAILMEHLKKRSNYNR